MVYICTNLSSRDFLWVKEALRQLYDTLYGFKIGFEYINTVLNYYNPFYIIKNGYLWTNG